jgi:hypothetical protein
MVLATTYRGLCQGCSKTTPDAIRVPLLLQLLLYVWFVIARPRIDLSVYDGVPLESGPVDG